MNRLTVGLQARGWDRQTAKNVIASAGAIAWGNRRMRIAAVHDIVSPIRSKIANAYIDFSQMTASIVAVVTDLKVDGKPVVGYGFNSNGRYAQQGLLNERFKIGR